MISPRKIPLVMDVDTGTDDAVCIAAATLCSGSLDLLGIGTVCGNVEIEKTSKNTLDLIDFLGCNTPVHIGASRPLMRELSTPSATGARASATSSFPMRAGPMRRAASRI